MITKEFQISNPDLVSMIHKAYPEGVKYANDVINLAVELDEVSTSFYNGSVINDYGIYPFLEVEEIHTENNNVIKDPVIISSEFIRFEFDQFISSLSISCKDFEEIKADIDVWYKKGSNLLDQQYKNVITYLIERLKCLKQREEVRNSFMQALFNVPIGHNHIVTLNSVINLEYLRSKIKKYNKKCSSSTGKWFKILPYPDVEYASIVSCEEYRLK